MEHDNQVEFAKLLAETMTEDGSGISHLDLLDYLAVVGLKLTRDNHADASIAYLTNLRDPLA